MTGVTGDVIAVTAVTAVIGGTDVTAVAGETGGDVGGMAAVAGLSRTSRRRRPVGYGCGQPVTAGTSEPPVTARQHVHRPCDKATRLFRSLHQTAQLCRDFGSVELQSMIEQYAGTHSSNGLMCVHAMRVSGGAT